MQDTWYFSFILIPFLNVIPSINIYSRDEDPPHCCSLCCHQLWNCCSYPLLSIIWISQKVPKQTSVNTIIYSCQNLSQKKLLHQWMIWLSIKDLSWKKNMFLCSVLCKSMHCNVGREPPSTQVLKSTIQQCVSIPSILLEIYVRMKIYRSMGPKNWVH